MDDLKFREACRCNEKYVLSEAEKTEFEAKRRAALFEEKHGFRFENDFVKTKITTRTKKKKTDIVSSSWWQITVHDPYLLKDIYDAIRDRSEDLGYERATQIAMYQKKYIKKEGGK